MNDLHNSLIKVLCSTGIFTTYDLDYEHIFKFAPLIDVDGFEFLYYGGWHKQLKYITNRIKTMGIKTPVLHADKEIGTLVGDGNFSQQEKGLIKLKENCEIAKKLDCEIIVIHLWEVPNSDKYIDKNLEMLSEFCQTADDFDLSLAIETIPCKYYSPIDHVLKILTMDERCKFALDTEFLSHHNQLYLFLNNKAIMEKVVHIHIKDYDGALRDRNNRRKYLHPGEGHIDFNVFFKKLSVVKYSGYLSLEASTMDLNGEFRLNKVKKTLNLLNEYINQL